MSQIPGEKARLAYLGPCGHPLPSGGREQFILTELCQDRMAWQRGGSSKGNWNIYQKKGKGILGQAETVDAP